MMISIEVENNFFIYLHSENSKTRKNYQGEIWKNARVAQVSRIPNAVEH